MALALLLHICADLFLKLALKFKRQMATVARKRLLQLPVRRNATKSTLQRAQKPHQLIELCEQTSFLHNLLLKHAGAKVGRQSLGVVPLRRIANEGGDPAKLRGPSHISSFTAKHPGQGLSHFIFLIISLASRSSSLSHSGTSCSKGG